MKPPADPFEQAEQAIARALLELEQARAAIARARAASVAPAQTSRRRPGGAHRIAEAIAGEHAAGLPLDDPLCRRVYIAAYETYTQALASGSKPQAARMAASVAAEEQIRP